jgi:hypothetical protein
MKLTEEQIWKCNQTINYESGEVVDAVHICVAHQNVVDFARSIEREIGFARAELWIKRINDAVQAEREAVEDLLKEYDMVDSAFAKDFRARSKESCTHEWIDDTKAKPAWRCIKCGSDYTKGKA